MINYYDKHLFISKKKLAELAGVSERTFRRYLATRRHILDEMGISPKAQLLPPQAVKYICEDYCIDLPPELQNQQVLEKCLSLTGVDSHEALNVKFLKSFKLWENKNSVAH